MKSSQKPNETRSSPIGLTSQSKIYKLELRRKPWPSYYKRWTLKIMIRGEKRRKKERLEEALGTGDQAHVMES